MGSSYPSQGFPPLLRRVFVELGRNCLRLRSSVVGRWLEPKARPFVGLVLAVLAVSTALVAQTPNDPQQLLKEAISLHRAGKLDEAIADYRALLEKYPNVAEVRSDLGAALAAAGRYNEAINEYERALKLQPMPQVQLNIGLAYYKSGQLRPAIEAFQKAQQQMPRENKPVLLQADCYLRLGQDKKVIELLDPLEQQSGNDLAVTYMLGTALVRDGQSDKGQVLIDKILKDGDSAEARLLIGTTKLMVNDFQGALTDLQKAVDLNPELPDVFAYYGAALVATGDQEGAKQAFAKALQQDPNNFEPNLRMGFLLRNDNEFEDAMKYLKRALEVRPGDPGVRYQIAAVELSQGNVEQARVDLESLVKESPDFTEAHVSLATAYYRQKRKEDGDRERAIVDKLTAQRRQTTEVGGNENKVQR
jgi:Flp pilus assembly protein TadD